MVVETEFLPFLSQFLGPDWGRPAVVFWLLVAVLAVAGCAAVVFFARRAVTWVPRLAGRLLVFGAVLYTVLVGLALWHGVLSQYEPESLSALNRAAFRVGGSVSSAATAWFGAEWTLGGLYVWLLVASLLLIATVAVGWLAAAVRNGPLAAVRITDRALCGAVIELARISPRRVWGLTRLSVKESIRRRVVVAFAVFILILLFAGWFLDTGSTNPARLYLSFVLTATSYLVLLLALFLSTFSLPADIRSKTIHTVVTKPVRSSEIVLGRILGFGLIGSGLLLVMGSISYVFVVRGLAHTHELAPAVVAQARKAVENEGKAGVDVFTSKVHNHRHPVHIAPDGTPSLGMENGHWHDIEAETSDSQTVYRIGPARGALLARVPVYGKLRFLDRQGRPAEKGINVGDEWTYRSYVEGGTSGAAIWRFEGIREKDFPTGLPLELTLGVFRTHKGNIERGIAGSISVRNPTTGATREVTIFTAKEFQTDTQFVPRTLSSNTPGVAKLDLFDDLVDDSGSIEIILRCLDPAQFYGVAQPDLYLRARDASFEVNFAKGYLGIWLQMLLVIGLGVTFSTFLSGPVAMLATSGVLVLGFFREFMGRLATGGTYGGGPVESLIRLVTQENVISEMEPGARTTMAKMMDVVFSGPLWVTSKILPPFGEFSCASYVAYGFDVSPDVMWGNALRALGFLLPVFVAGYFFLKSREVAK